MEENEECVRKNKQNNRAEVRLLSLCLSDKGNVAAVYVCLWREEQREKTDKEQTNRKMRTS